jgi:hypothetical protein
MLWYVSPTRHHLSLAAERLINCPLMRPQSDWGGLASLCAILSRYLTVKYVCKYINLPVDLYCWYTRHGAPASSCRPESCNWRHIYSKTENVSDRYVIRTNVRDEENGGENAVIGRVFMYPPNIY